MSSEYIVKPSQIEEQLTTIWDSLQGKGKTRACLFNLVIYASKNARTDYLYQVAQKVINKFPSRIVFVTIDEKAPDDTLKTSVAAITSESEDSSTACDLINILLSLKNRERAPFMVLPHLMTDLPIYLLWGDDPAQVDPVSQKLEKLATRVIFDSEATKDLPLFCNSILKHKELSGSDVADLNWARIAGWRQLLAETFKDKDHFSTLSRSTTVEITYNSAVTPLFCHNKIQALYLQGWLTSRMGWLFKKSSKEGENTVFFYDNHGASIKVVLIPKAIEEAAPGRVLEMKLSDSQGHLFHFTRAKEQAHMILVEYSTPTYCQLPSQFIFDKYESGQSLVKEIFHRGTSAHYLTLIKQIAKFKDEGMCL